METRTRVLIVDDHPSFRTCARMILESDGFAVIGEAEDGAQADGRRESSPGHLSRDRTAVPESSAFGMKPRARLFRIRPS